MNFTKKLILFAALSFPFFSCGKDEPSKPDTPQQPDEKPTEYYVNVTLRNTGEKLEGTYDIDYKAHEDAVIVKSNTAWTVSASPSADWLKFEKGSTVLSYLKTSFNTTGKERSATLTFSSEAGGKLAELVVRQSASDKIGKSDFMDMMLLEYDRTDIDYKGYLLYEKDGRVQWLFDAFCPGMGRYNGQTIGEGENACHLNKEQTTDILDTFFKDGEWLSRINRIVSELKPKVPGKFVRKKIVISIPLIVNDNWGELDGKELHPSNEDAEGRADRVTIAKWFVDETLKRFSEKDYENLQLIGFYWQEENGRIWEENGKSIADYIHSYNLDFYWVPWYEAYNNTKWKDYGFDKAWLQPNYHFDANATRQRLYDAYDKATANGMLLEMEWDNLKPLQKHIDYWDVYEEKGVLAAWPLTYYESGSMFPSRDNIIDSDWKAFYERVAKDIADRQKKFYNY